MMFRKITTLFVTLLLLVSLTGCMLIPMVKKLDLHYDVSEITSIEIFNLGDEVYDVYDLEELIDDNFIPAATLTSEQFSEFADRVGEFRFTDTYVIALASVQVDYSFAGYVVKITYANGEYELLSNGSQAYKNEKGHYMDSYSCDEGDWNRFIEEYLEE